MGIRTAQAAELERLREIELAAGIAFAEIGMDDVATAEPPQVETLATYQKVGQAWVQADDDRVVAYLIAEDVDGALHIEQVSVDPVFAGRGLGRELIEHVAAWGRRRGYSVLTLTTFTEVPWNGPYYERLGFRYLHDDELSPGLRAIRSAEAASGLDRWPRAAMVRSLSPSS